MTCPNTWYAPSRAAVGLRHSHTCCASAEVHRAERDLPPSGAAERRRAPVQRSTLAHKLPNVAKQVLE